MNFSVKINSVKSLKVDFSATFAFCQALKNFFLLKIKMDNMNKTKQGHIGQRIKTSRIEKGLTQEELGEKLGLDKGTVSKMERGENAPTAKTLIALKKILGVSTDWILTGKGLKHPLEIDTDDEVGQGLLEMINDLLSNQSALIKVLSFFFEYKAKNLATFYKKKNKKMKNG